MSAHAAKARARSNYVEVDASGKHFCQLPRIVLCEHAA
jgi:hypothetical protein